MLKYFMKLKNRKGFTLTELIIVIAIIAILMGCVAAFSGPIRQMVKLTASSTDALTANKIIGDYIENRLAFADKIDMYYAVDADDSANATLWGIPNTFTRYKGMDDTANNRDKCGVLIFHYDENTDEPEKSTYALYDFPITSASVDYNSTVIDATTSYILEDGAVFDKAFYENSQNLILAPYEISYNNARGTLNMNFDIVPYDCREDYLVRNANGSLNTASSQYVKPSIIQNYYDKVHQLRANPALEADPSFDKSFGLDEIKDQRSGAKESITFSMNNINFASKIVLKADGTKDTDKSVENWLAHYANYSTTFYDGTDIVIFYHIPYYG